ncbi:classical arabinogalactan protein 9-like [Cervus elaphus]|uniref:classical arabinogalactan protein 9-like n=1 Tax=Cervus elaphus TaxID=9860 RepID=UPI001CC2A90C|nr:classical arabinogalactan protein 9-like [Cervus elaphus]
MQLPASPPSPTPAAAALTPAGRPPPPGPPPGRQHGRLPPACTAALALSRTPRPGRPPHPAPRPPPCLALLPLREQEGGPRSGGSGSVKHQPSAAALRRPGLHQADSTAGSPRPARRRSPSQGHRARAAPRTRHPGPLPASRSFLSGSRRAAPGPGARVPLNINPQQVSTRALSRVCDAGREEAEAAGGAWRNLCTRVLLLALALLAFGV